METSLDSWGSESSKILRVVVARWYSTDFKINFKATSAGEVNKENGKSHGTIRGTGGANTAAAVQPLIVRRASTRPRES